MDKQDWSPEQAGHDDVPEDGAAISRSKLLKTAGVAGAGVLLGGITGNGEGVDACVTELAPREQEARARHDRRPDRLRRRRSATSTVRTQPPAGRFWA